MPSCAPNSDICTENNGGMSGALALQSDLSCNSINHTKNVSDSRAVVHYAERPYATSTHKWLIRKRLRCVFGTITHESFLACSSTQEIDICDSRAVIQYVECLPTYSFQVMSVSTHKMSYRKESVMCVWSHNSPVVSHIQL